MAVNMDKGLYSAPVGLDALGDTGESVDFELELPDLTDENDVDVEILLSESEIDTENEDFDSNLAENMSESELSSIADDIDELVTADINSRKDWADSYVKGLEVLGLKYEQRTEPWDGACGVFSTVLTEAAIRFQAETIMETFPAQGPVKTQIVGEIDELKEEAADRVKDDMNYQLTEKMTEYRSEHERMLFSLGLAGAAFKKDYFDPSLDRQVSL